MRIDAKQPVAEPGEKVRQLRAGVAQGRLIALGKLDNQLWRMSSGKKPARAAEHIEFTAINIDFDQVHAIDVAPADVVVEGQARRRLRRLARRGYRALIRADIGKPVQGDVIFQYREGAWLGFKAVDTALGPDKARSQQSVLTYVGSDNP